MTTPIQFAPSSGRSDHTHEAPQTTSIPASIGGSMSSRAGPAPTARPLPPNLQLYLGLVASQEAKEDALEKGLTTRIPVYGARTPKRQMKHMTQFPFAIGIITAGRRVDAFYNEDVDGAGRFDVDIPPLKSAIDGGDIFNFSLKKFTNPDVVIGARTFLNNQVPPGQSLYLEGEACDAITAAFNRLFSLDSGGGRHIKNMPLLGRIHEDDEGSSNGSLPEQVATEPSIHHGNGSNPLRPESEG